MIQAIVYESRTGYTQQYANLLSDRVGVPAMSRKDAKSKLAPHTPIVFMGWLRAGQVVGYTDAAKYFDVRALCGVGMGFPAQETVQAIRKAHAFTGGPVLCLQGGLNPDKLKGLYGFMMRIVRNSIRTGIEKKPTRTQLDEDMLELVQKGGSRVNATSLDPLVEWFEKEQNKA